MHNIHPSHAIQVRRHLLVIDYLTMCSLYALSVTSHSVSLPSKFRTRPGLTTAMARRYQFLPGVVMRKCYALGNLHSYSPALFWELL